MSKMMWAVTITNNTYNWRQIPAVNINPAAYEVERTTTDTDQPGPSGVKMNSTANQRKSEDTETDAETGEFIESAPLLKVKPCNVELINLSPRAVEHLKKMLASVKPCNVELTNLSPRAVERLKKTLAYSHRLRPVRSTPRSGPRKALRRASIGTCCAPKKKIRRTPISGGRKGREMESDGLAGSSKHKKTQKQVKRDLDDELNDCSLDSDEEGDPRQSELYRKMKKVLGKQWEPDEVPEDVIWNLFHNKLTLFERQFYPPPWHDSYRGPGIRVLEWEFDQDEVRPEELQFFGATGPVQSANENLDSDRHPACLAWFEKKLKHFLLNEVNKNNPSEKELEGEEAQGSDKHQNIEVITLVHLDEDEETETEARVSSHDNLDNFEGSDNEVERADENEDVDVYIVD